MVLRKSSISKIISGGQTGADRAALDFALENGFEIGGFVPKGRLAEDGRIADNYSNLSETKTPNPPERTELNVRRADATLIVSDGPLRGGSRLTRELAQKHKKPFLHIDLAARTVEQAVKKTGRWLASITCQTLNIAGPRASEDPEIYGKTREFLDKLM